MSRTAFTVLRVGLGITFVWIGVLIFREPENWGALLQPWAAGLLPVPLRDAMLGTAILDILVGLALLVDVWVLAAAVVGAVHIVTVLVTVGIQAVTVRDIAIGAGLAALAADRWPARWWPRKRTGPIDGRTGAV